MKIKFFSATELGKPIRLAVHKIGNLGLTKRAEKLLEITKHRSVSIGINSDDKDDKNLYMVLNKDDNEEAFSIKVNSGYYYIATTTLFDKLNLDYANGKLAFNLTRLQDGSNTYYKLEKVERKTVPSKR